MPVDRWGERNVRQKSIKPRLLPSPSAVAIAPQRRKAATSGETRRAAIAIPAKSRHDRPEREITTSELIRRRSHARCSHGTALRLDVTPMYIFASEIAFAKKDVAIDSVIDSSLIRYHTLIFANYFNLQIFLGNSPRNSIVLVSRKNDRLIAQTVPRFLSLLCGLSYFSSSTAFFSHPLVCGKLRSNTNRAVRRLMYENRRSLLRCALAILLSSVRYGRQKGAQRERERGSSEGKRTEGKRERRGNSCDSRGERSFDFNSRVKK